MENNLSKQRILVVGHELLLHADFQSLINEQPDLSCSQAPDSMSIPAAVALEKPDLVMLSLRLNNEETFELTNSLRLEFPNLQMLVLSMGDEAFYAERALQAGARGYIMRDEAGEELLTAIRTILSGKIYLSHSMSVRLVERVLKPGPSRAKQKPV